MPSIFHRVNDISFGAGKKDWPFHKKEQRRMSKQKLAFLIVLVCFFMLSFTNRATCYPLVESPIGETEEDKEAPEERKLVFFGDFRIRYEGFFQQGEPTRNRDRLRLRFGLQGSTENFNYGMRIATGDPRNPISPNQSFSEFFTRKSFYLDRAYLEFSPKNMPFASIFGKFGPQHLTTSLVWDSDVNPEGACQSFSYSSGKLIKNFRIHVMEFVLNEESKKEDAWMIGVQGLVEFRISNASSFTFAAGDYNYINEDQIALAIDRGDLMTHMTNSMRYEDGVLVGYLSEFHLVEFLFKYNNNFSPRWPMSLMVQYVRNVEAERGNNATFTEFSLGTNRSPAEWLFRWTYWRPEKDSVLAAYMESEFPGTGYPSHRLQFSMGTFRDQNVIFSLYLSTKIEDETYHLLKKVQVDYNLRF